MSFPWFSCCALWMMVPPVSFMLTRIQHAHNTHRCKHWKEGIPLKEQPIEADWLCSQTLAFSASTQRLLPKSWEPKSILSIISHLGKGTHKKKALCVLLQKKTVLHHWRSFFLPFILWLSWILALSFIAVIEITETEALCSSLSRKNKPITKL